MGKVFGMADDFAKDPREKRICLKEGAVWEEDNRIVDVYHWNGTTLNTCGTDALSWNHPPIVRVEGGGGDSSGSTSASTSFYVVFRKSTEELSIEGDNVVSGKDGTTTYYTNIPPVSAEIEELIKKYENGEITEEEFNTKIDEYNEANRFVVSFLALYGKTMTVIDGPTGTQVDGLEKLTKPFFANGEAWQVYEWDGPDDMINPGDNDYCFIITVS